MSIPTQSIIMPYHRNKEMLLYTTELLAKIVPDDVEIIIVGNNENKNELDVTLSDRFQYIKYYESMLYSRTVNAGVDAASGEIITLCDQDIYSYTDWYTPLLKKLLSNPNIGSVSSKLLNPTNNRIIDFGIEYSLYRIVHPFRGQTADHPLTQEDRKVTSTTSATLMMYKKTYLEVQGMDVEMPYCCSDCDIGIKIGQLGLENWVVGNSVAYHRGSSSSANGKSSSFSHLLMDSHCMFWTKNRHRLKPTIGDTLKLSAEYLITHVKSQQLYCFINLSSVYEYKWYAEQIKMVLEIEYSDIYTYKTIQGHYSDTIQIYDTIPYTFIKLGVPIIYFVDYFPTLTNNIIWSKMRQIDKDIIVDIHGNIVMLQDLLNNEN